MNKPHPRPLSARPRSHLVLGLILAAVGAVLLAGNLGYGIPWFVWGYWPVLLMAIGLIGLIAPGRHLSRSGGMWLLASGLYCQIGVSKWFGLGWWSAWPIFLITAGFDLMLFKHADKHAGNGDGVTRGT